MTDLDALVRTARDATVRRDEADAYVRGLEQWARPERRAWWPWVIASAAVAAAIALLVIRRAPVEAMPPPVAIGERVAIVAAPGTEYRVIAAGADQTRIAVVHGTVTARLGHGGAPHQLSLEGGGVVALATGTVYSLTVDAHGGAVRVERGTVIVRDAHEVHTVEAGTAWPPSTKAGDPHVTEALLALPLDHPPPPPVVAPDAAIADAAVEVDAPVDARTLRTVVPIDAPPPVKERWHHARLLRGQGKYQDAVAECLAIADSHDATWAPIALVEAARIYLGPLSDPDHALAVAERAIAEWPNDALVGEARELRCRALGELGRGAECAAKQP